MEYYPGKTVLLIFFKFMFLILKFSYLILGCFYTTKYMDERNCAMCFWDGRDRTYGESNNYYYNTNKKKEVARSTNLGYINPNDPVFQREFDRWSAITGCSYHDITQTQCFEGGGIWLNRYFSKQECSSAEGCREPPSHFCSEYQTGYILSRNTYFLFYYNFFLISH